MYINKWDQKDFKEFQKQFEKWPQEIRQIIAESELDRRDFDRAGKSNSGTVECTFGRAAERSHAFRYSDDFDVPLSASRLPSRLSPAPPPGCGGPGLQRPAPR